MFVVCFFTLYRMFYGVYMKMRYATHSFFGIYTGILCVESLKNSYTSSETLIIIDFVILTHAIEV